MSVNINADTTNGLVLTSDTSGELKLQSAGVDIATVSSTGIAMSSGMTLPASALTGSLPAIDGSALTGIETGQVLEYITGVCDGNTVTTPHGSYTLTNVSAAQNLSTSYAVVNGSSITYTPPADTKKVLYRFSFMNRFINNHAIEHFKFYIDSNEVTLARFNTGAQYKELLVNFEWVMDIGNSTNSTTGRLSSWNTDKTLQLRARHYASGNDGNLHETYYWDGGASPQLHKPTLTLIAIG